MPLGIVNYAQNIVIGSSDSLSLTHTRVHTHAENTSDKWSENLIVIYLFFKYKMLQLVMIHNTKTGYKD